MISRVQYFSNLSVTTRRWNIVVYSLLIAVAVFLTTKSVFEAVDLIKHAQQVNIPEDVFINGMSLFNSFLILMVLSCTTIFIAYLTRNMTMYWLKDSGKRNPNYLSIWLMAMLEYSLIAISVLYVLLMLVRMELVGQRAFEINAGLLFAMYFTYMGMVGVGLLGVTKRVYWIGYAGSLIFYSVLVFAITR